MWVCAHVRIPIMQEDFVKDMMACDANGLLMVNVTKMYHTPDCESFDAFGRVISGTLKVGHSVKVSTVSMCSPVIASAAGRQGGT